MVYKMIPFNSLRVLREAREGATESAVVPASAGDTPLHLTAAMLAPSGLEGPGWDGT
jgi:hypothetical protein